MLSLNEEEIEFIKENETKFRDYLGKRSKYYISAWTIKPKFNFASSFGGIFWLGYHGMFFTLFLLISLGTTVNLFFYGSLIHTIYIFFAIFLYGVFGNTLFYYKVKKNILEDKKPSNTFFKIFVTLIIFCVYLFINLLLIL
jgi:hypothetical protein